MSRPLLLDTHVVLWLLGGARDRIGASLQRDIADPDTTVYYSAMTPWEIAIKASLGKLEIESSWPQVLRQLPLRELPIVGQHAERVQALPFLHRDPFDRLLVCQAQAEAAVIVTADHAIARYKIEVRHPGN